MTKKYLLNLWLILFSTISAQQFDPNQLPKIGVLQGTVIDSITQLPIQYASISLISQRSNDIITGGVSDENGKFDILQIPLGRYNVSIEYIGYTRLLKGPIAFNPRENTTNINFGTVNLVRSALSFQDVEVEGNRPLFVQTMEKKIFNVEQNNISAGGSALDALRQVPGVDVDIDGKISLRGSGNVNVLIDGKPSTLTGGDRQALLENIPSDNVRDIEVVTNPSAKYDPEGMAGIINIVLKENKFAGMNGNVKTGISTLGSYNGSGQINFRNEKLNIFSNLGLRHDVRDIGGENYRETILSDYTSILDQTIDGERGGDNIFLKSGLEYFPNIRNTIGFNFTYSDGTRINDQVVDTEETTDAKYLYERLSSGESDRSSIDASLTYDRKYGDPKQKLSANILFSTSDNSDKDTQITIPYIGYEDLIEPDPEKTSTNNKYNTTNAQLDYTHPFGASTKLEVGYKGIIRSIDNLFDTYEFDEPSESYFIDNERSNHFLYDESIHAGYAVFSLQKDIIGIQSGIRAENVKNTSELIDTDEKRENTYTSYFPSFALSVGPPQIFQVQLSYSKRVDRPSYRNLNPSIHQMDQYNMRMGNPFLKPEYIDVAELNFSKFTKGLSLSVGTYYRRVNDKISQL